LGFCEALATGKTDFREEAAAEIARILDEICGLEMMEIVTAYDRRREQGVTNG